MELLIISLIGAACMAIMIVAKSLVTRKSRRQLDIRITAAKARASQRATVRSAAELLDAPINFAMDTFTLNDKWDGQGDLDDVQIATITRLTQHIPR